MMHKALALILLLGAIPWAPLASQVGQLKLPPYKKAKLQNGLTLLLMEQHEVPIVSFHFIIMTGSVADPVGKEGTAAVTAALLRKGTKTRTADQIAQHLDFIGATFSASTTHDFAQGQAEFLKKDLAAGLEMLGDLLLNPSFAQAEFDKLVKQRIDSLRQAKDQAQAVINDYYEAFLYGAHPYGRPVGGDEKSLRNIVREDVVDYYRTFYVPNQTLLAVSGDFEAAELESALRSRFGAWPAKRVQAPRIPDPPDVQGRRVLLVDKPDATQTTYRVGNIGIARTSPDYVGITLVNTLFGGRFTSMLNSELRINTGLTYGAGSSFEERKSRGPFAIRSFTANATTEQILDKTMEILRHLHEKGISEEQLQSAKNYIKGQFPPTIETTNQLAALVAELEFYGLDEREINTYYERIDALTMKEARRIIQQYFPLDHLVFVLIGKADEIRAVAKKFGSVTEKSISQPGF